MLQNVRVPTDKQIITNKCLKKYTPSGYEISPKFLPHTRIIVSPCYFIGFRRRINYNDIRVALNENDNFLCENPVKVSIMQILWEVCRPQYPDRSRRIFVITFNCEHLFVAYYYYYYYNYYTYPEWYFVNRNRLVFFFFLHPSTRVISR